MLNFLFSLLAILTYSASNVGSVHQTFSSTSDYSAKKEENETVKNDSNFTFYPCTSSDYPNATYITNAFYFDNLNGYYGLNQNGICGIISAQVLLGYHDTFDNDNIVPERFDVDGTHNISTNQVSSWAQSPGTDKYLTSETDSFRNYLIDKFTDVNNTTPYGGTTEYQIKQLINRHLNDVNVSATLHYHTSENSFHSDIEEIIDANRPVLATLPTHFIVIYGYDSNYYYCDTGWGYSARIAKTDFDFSESTSGLIDLANIQHVHSNNYYNTSSHNLYCGCGAFYSKRVLVNPSDWGFQERYYFDIKNDQHLIDGVSFNSKRVRTGYIQSTVVNLSPRRSGAGYAYFYVRFPYEICNFHIEMAWWSAGEHQNDGYAEVFYHEDGDNEDLWYGDFCNIHSLNLNNTYTDLTNHSFSMPIDCDGVGIALSNSSIGDRNLGRLSLGIIKIDYYE